jgi:hypothetical protein
VTPPDLWRCPTCGRTFVSRNMPHSCEVRSVDEHFARADPRLREVFDALVAAVEHNGPVTVRLPTGSTCREPPDPPPTYRG